MSVFSRKRRSVTAAVNENHIYFVMWYASVTLILMVDEIINSNHLIDYNALVPA